MAKTIAQALLWGALCIFLLFAVGGTVYMAGLSMITWWKPLVVCAVIGIFSAPLQQLVKAKMTLWLRCLIQVVAVTVTCLFAFFLANFLTAQKAPVQFQDVVVTRVYREQHYKTKRVGRRTYTRGAPYWVYCMDVELADGRMKTVSISKKRYRQVDKGDTVGLATRRGIAGIDVIAPANIRY